MDISAIVFEVLNDIFTSIIEAKTLRILIVTLFAVLFVFGLLLLIYNNLPSFIRRKVQGWFGEKTVSAILSALPKEYKPVNDVMLRQNNGKTTQVDHIVVSPYGIFVIETKNYKGYITGSEYGERWTKNKKYSFQNPIRQNYGHIKALSELLSLPEDMFISVIVFSIEADVKVKTEKHLIYTVHLRKTIRSYQQRKLNDAQVDTFVQIIHDANVDSQEVRKEHVQNITRESRERDYMIERKICPKCQNILVERNGKYGKFLGCSQYPKCRFTSKL